MLKDDSYAGKTQAIRSCLAEHPDAAPERIVELLAEEGVQVSPAHVFVVQTVARSARTNQVAAAS